MSSEILKNKLEKRKSLVIGLEGELGSGKTTFVQGMAEGFGVEDQVRSPSFVILRKYKIAEMATGDFSGLSSVVKWFYHIDCYRISRPQEILEFQICWVQGRGRLIIPYLRAAELIH